MRSWRPTHWRALAFIFRGKIRALAEDGFLELLLNTTRLEEITVPMISAILWLPFLEKGGQGWSFVSDIVGLVLGVEPI